MKRCPECRRNYYDETLLYCLDDGTALVDGPASGNEARTEIIARDSSSFDDKKTALMDSDSSDQATSSRSARSRRGVFVVAAIVLIGIALGSAWTVRKYWGSGDGDSPTFTKFNVTRVTTSGRAQEATISGDGKYIVYLEMAEDGNRSLWVRQTATGAAIPIVPPTKGNILKGTTFSHDGNFVYYLFSDRTKPMALYKIPSLGGTPKKIVDMAGSLVGVSPDGQRLALTRYDPSTANLVTVDADGSDEKVLASLGGDEWFGDSGPSWSPDGKTIAVTGGVLSGTGERSRRLIGVDTTDGSIRDLSPKRWVEAGRVAWMPDGKSLILIAQEKPDESNWQVWQVGYPSGTATQITNDVLARDETSLGVTGDGRSLLTVTVQRRSRIESIPATGGTDVPIRISLSETDTDGLEGMSILADGRIVFASQEGGQADIWIMNADGARRQKLTSDAFRDGAPAVSPDGQYVFFVSNRPDGDAVPRLWRMNIDGSNPVQISPLCESFPSVSPDGKSVIFSVFNQTDRIRSLISVPVEGGQPVPLIDGWTGNPAFSPDGKWIGVHYSDKATIKWRFGIFPIQGGDAVRHFEFPGYQYEWVRWTDDSRHLSFIGAPPDPSNIWLQPVDGGEPRKLTDFKSDYIYRHEWSPDGKTLFLVRGRPAFDVILQIAAP